MSPYKGVKNFVEWQSPQIERMQRQAKNARAFLLRHNRGQALAHLEALIKDSDTVLFGLACLAERFKQASGDVN